MVFVLFISLSFQIHIRIRVYSAFAPKSAAKIQKKYQINKYFHKIRQNFFFLSSKCHYAHNNLKILSLFLAYVKKLLYLCSEIREICNIR